LSPLFTSGQDDSSSDSSTILTGTTHGTIKSGGFPTPYGDNIDQTWEIRVREGYRVHIYFTTFDLEDSYEDDIGACAYDYVQVRIMI